MRFIMLIYETPAQFAAREEGVEGAYVGAWRAYYQALVAAGAYLDGAPLAAVETATTVRATEGRRRVQDGPFAETKEQLGGFILLELPSLDAALDWAARCPAAARAARSRSARWRSRSSRRSRARSDRRRRCRRAPRGRGRRAHLLRPTGRVSCCRRRAT